MPTWRHRTRGTVVTTTAAMGADWELADSPSTPDDKAPEAPKKAPEKKTPRARKAAGTTPKE